MDIILPKIKWASAGKDGWACNRMGYKMTITQTPKGLFHWEVIGETFADFEVAQTKALAMARAEIAFIRLFLKGCSIRTKTTQ